MAVATALASAETWAAEPNPFAPNAPSPVAPKPLSPGELKVFQAPKTPTPVPESPLPQAAPMVETPVQKSVEVGPTPIEPDTETVSPVASDATPDSDSDTDTGRLDSLENIFTSEETEEDAKKLDAPQPKTNEQSPPAKPIVENIEIPQMAPEVQVQSEKPVAPSPARQSAPAPEIPQVTDIAVQQRSTAEDVQPIQQPPDAPTPQGIETTKTSPTAETQPPKQRHEENAGQGNKLETRSEPVVAPEIPSPVQPEIPETTIKEATAQPVVPEGKELNKNRPDDTATSQRDTPPANALVEKSPSYLQLGQMRSPKTKQGFFDRLAEMLTPESKPKTSAPKVSIDIPDKKLAKPSEKTTTQTAENGPDIVQAAEEESAAPVESAKIEEDRQTASSVLESLVDEPAKASDQSKVPEIRIVEEVLSDKAPLKAMAPDIPEATAIDPTPKPVAVEAQSLDPALPKTVKTVEAASTPKPMEQVTPEPAVPSQPTSSSKVSQPQPIAQVAEEIEPLEPAPEAAMPVETPDIPAPSKMLADAPKPSAPVPDGITPIDPKALDAEDKMALPTMNVSEQPAFTTLNKTPETLIAETPQEDEDIGLFGRLTRLFSDDQVESESQSSERRIVVEAQDPPSENNTMDAVQVAAVQPEAQLPPPRDATFKTDAWGLGDNVHLTQLEPTQDGKNIPCFDKSFLARTHCVVDVNWPANLKKAFNGGGVLYNGTKAIVAYDQGRATRLYTLFESNSYEAVVAHFQKKLGPPHFRSIRKIRVLQGPRLANDFVVWHMGKSSSNDGPVTVEIRRYDDVRQTFPDTNSGLVRVYFDHTIPLFKRVSPLDFLSLR